MKKRRKNEQDGDEKLRRCLMCGDDFLSAWPGERICRRCRSTASWKMG